MRLNCHGTHRFVCCLAVCIYIYSEASKQANKLIYIYIYILYSLLLIRWACFVLNLIWRPFRAVSLLRWSVNSSLQIYIYMITLYIRCAHSMSLFCCNCVCCDARRDFLIKFIIPMNVHTHKLIPTHCQQKELVVSLKEDSPAFQLPSHALLFLFNSKVSIYAYSQVQCNASFCFTFLFLFSFFFFCLFIQWLLSVVVCCFVLFVGCLLLLLLLLLFLFYYYCLCCSLLVAVLAT